MGFGSLGMEESHFIALLEFIQNKITTRLRSQSLVITFNISFCINAYPTIKVRPKS